MEKKFELTEKYVVNELGTKLYQIKCTKTFEYAKKGELGGYIEREVNLSQEGNAWVFGDAQVSGDARVSGNAWVSGDAQVSGDARVSGDAWVYGDAWVSGDARVFGYARVYGDAQVSGYARVSGDAQVSGNACLKSDADHCGFDCFGSSNRHTHAYLTSDNTVEITCGYFRGSIEEFEKKVKNTHAGTVYENQYNAIINVIKIKFGSAQRQNRQV
jgi:carbonic anhydrase/acetyltransferase-like protein (isoleucine patch superfamily)